MGSTEGSTASATPRRAIEGPVLARAPLATVTTALGFILALASTLGGPTAASSDMLLRRVTVALPDWLVVAVFGSVLLAGAIGIALVLPRSRGGRKKGEDEYEMYQEPRRLPPLLGIALIALALSPAAALTGVLFWFGHESVAPPERGSIIAQHLPFSSPPAISAPSSSAEREPASLVTTGLVGAVGVLASFGVLAFVAWLGFGHRWLRREELNERYRTRVVRAVDVSLEDLRSEPDARIAVQKIYRNFERVMAADVPKRAWQTPSEFTRAALEKLPLRREPVEDLTHLFEIARFSAHPLDIDARDRAWRSLNAILASIDADRGGGAEAHVS